MPKDNRILKPTNKSPSAATPSPNPKKSSSFFSRLTSAISNSFSPHPPPSPKIVKVRLINSWQDVNPERVNAVVRNFLYEKNSEMTPRWHEMERATGFKREQLFYSLTALLGFVLFYGHFISTLLLFAIIIIPGVCSLHAVNAKLGNESQIYWLRYWIIFCVLTILESCFLRLFPNTNLDSAKLILAVVVIFVPYPVIPTIFEAVNKYFLAIRDKFEQYNYHVVA